MLAGFAAWFSEIPKSIKIGFGILVVVVLALVLVYCSGQHSGKSQIQHQIDKGNLKAEQINANAVSNSTEDRSITDTQLLEKKKELIDEVNKTPDTMPSAQRIAVGCERLRRQGTNTAAIPACNRH